MSTRIHRQRDHAARRTPAAGWIARLEVVGLAVLICVAPLAASRAAAPRSARIVRHTQNAEPVRPAVSAPVRSGDLLFVRSNFTEAEGVEKMALQATLTADAMVSLPESGRAAFGAWLADGRVLLCRRDPLVVPQRC